MRQRIHNILGDEMDRLINDSAEPSIHSEILDIETDSDEEEQVSDEVKVEADMLRLVNEMTELEIE